MSWYIPFVYGFRSRVPTGFDRLSFACLFLLPLLYVCGTETALPPGRFVLCFALAVTAQYSLYELGYLQNDLYTATREAAPTFRLPPAARQAVAARWRGMVVLRLGVAALALYGVALWLPVTPFLCGLAMLCLCFALHNGLRCRWNILTYFLLCSMKYATLPLLFCPAAALPGAVGTLFFAFVLPRAVEHAAKPKYGLGLLAGVGSHGVRVLYYVALSTATLAGWAAGLPWQRAAVLALWFCFFRAAVWLAFAWRGDPRRKKQTDA